LEKKEIETMDIAEVRKVASLARLSLNEQELAACGEQLTVILDYVSQLNEVDTTDVAPMPHPIPAENIFRDDVHERNHCPATPLWPTHRRPTACFSSCRRSWKKRARKESVSFRTSAIGFEPCPKPCHAAR
jgi:aspartyl/glutamyl-tRNA(Asn/Gln) amidotransferase C subunit